MKIGVTPYQIGIMFAVNGVIGALIQGVVIRKYVKKRRGDDIHRIGLVLSALGFILLLFSTNVFTAGLYLAVFGAGNGLIRPCVTSLITQKTTVGQGVATGLSSSMDSLGRILGPLLGAFLYGYNISLPFLSGAVLCIAALILLYLYSAADYRSQITQKKLLPPRVDRSFFWKINLRAAGFPSVSLRVPPLFNCLLPRSQSI